MIILATLALLLVAVLPACLIALRGAADRVDHILAEADPRPEQEPAWVSRRPA